MRSSTSRTNNNPKMSTSVVSVTSNSFTTIYNYDNGEEQHVFTCRGRPFVALISPQITTLPFTIIDYDFIKSVGLELTDVQCRPFRYDGHKMRILGQVSTTIQCVQDGMITKDFRFEALVASDLYGLLDSHCVIVDKMKERIAALKEDYGTSDDEPDYSQDVENAAAQTCVAAQTVLKARLVEDSSSSPLGKRAHSSAPG